MQDDVKRPMKPESLTSWRQRMNWTKTRASAELGLSPNGIAGYESGRWPIPRYIALACAAIAHGLPPIGA
jgi:predicted transcriptional regulator